MHKLLKASLALQLAVAGLALAQTNTENRDILPQDQKTGGVLDIGDKKAPSGSIRASKLIGMEIYNKEGKHLGEIKDIVLDESQKRVGYAVLSYGGLAGLGDKLFALPHRMIEHSAADDRLVIGLDEQTLRNAPGFDQSKWPTEANADYYRKLDSYYKDKGDRRADLPGDDARTAGDTMNDMAHDAKDTLKDTGDKTHDAMTDTGDRTHDQALPAAGHTGADVSWNRRVSSLIGANVENANGDNLGEVKDLVLDWGKGDVRYAVLSYGGLMGLGDKLFAVPVDAFTTQADNNKLVLNVSKDQLKNAPGFNQDQWPNMADPQWGKTVDDFYRQNRATQTDQIR